MSTRLGGVLELGVPLPRRTFESLNSLSGRCPQDEDHMASIAELQALFRLVSLLACRVVAHGHQMRPLLSRYLQDLPQCCRLLELARSKSSEVVSQAAAKAHVFPFCFTAAFASQIFRLTAFQWMFLGGEDQSPNAGQCPHIAKSSYLSSW